MICTQCFKSGVETVAVAVHFGKSLCREHLPGSIEFSLIVVAQFEELQDMFRKSSEEIGKTNERLLKSVEKIEAAVGKYN